MSRPHNCRHCSFMVCGDANWCSEHEEVMSDMQIWVARKCRKWEWNPMDALTLKEWEPTPSSKRAVLDGQMSMEVETSLNTAETDSRAVVGGGVMPNVVYRPDHYAGPVEAIGRR